MCNNWIKLIPRIPCLFSVGVENHQFLENLVVSKELLIDTSMINEKVILIMIVRITK